MTVSTAARLRADAPLFARSPARVMIVDDSIVARAVLARMIDAEPDLAVVAQAGTSRAALEALAHCQVDVIVLDLEMPGGGGLAALPALIAACDGARVLIVSSAAAAGAEATLAALRLGAADTLLKPTVGFGDTFARALTDRLRRLSLDGAATVAPPPPVRDVPERQRPADDIRCIAIGASTGGVHALAAFFAAYPRSIDAPILITQHLPTPFMIHFARQLGEMAGRAVAIASDGMAIVPGAIVLAPGDASLSLFRLREQVHVRLQRDRGASGCLPSVDPMFAAAAHMYGSGAIGVVLSGMGRDGLIGAQALRAAGGVLLAQDAATSVVWGMPGAVVRAGLATNVLPPDEIARRLGVMARRPRGRR